METIEFKKKLNTFSSHLLSYHTLIKNRIVKEEHLERIIAETGQFIGELNDLSKDWNNEVITLVVEKGSSLLQKPQIWHKVPRPGEILVNSSNYSQSLEVMLKHIEPWLSDLQSVIDDVGSTAMDKERLDSTIPLITDIKNVEQHVRSAFQKVTEGTYPRNVIDDSRLAFENALRALVFEASLENNTKRDKEGNSRLETYLKEKNVSSRLNAMIYDFSINLIAYNNKGVKHQGNDAEKTDFEMNEARLTLFFTLEIIIFLKSL